MAETYATIDGGEAAALVAHRTAEVIAIYPITPSSPMAELADEWSAAGRTNVWGSVPSVVQMQSEAGVAGAIHGALQAGSVATTFTASQGLLLMLPNMFKIAGELSPVVFHVAARTVATHALSIFGDHSDVMAVRTAGWGMLCSSSVQEAHDFALVSTRATFATRVPLLHFFDGFRTSHEINKITLLEDETIRGMLYEPGIRAHRERGLSPDRPVLRGSAQNPDVFFQAREASNSFHDSVPAAVQEAFDRLAEATGRQYHLFDYYGDPNAESVIVLMGSGVGAVSEAVDLLRIRGGRVGVLVVRLFRPFSTADFVAALPTTVQRIAVLDRTKEPGAIGEPLYQDVVTALHESGSSRFSQFPLVIGGRYGLASKEFTPAMAVGVFEELERPGARTHFTVGINDDVTNLSIPFDRGLDMPGGDGVSAVFYALGSDGTVGANKNTIKIIGDQTDLYAQGYFVYDSKKSGAITVSHLRFGRDPIRSTYLIDRADFVACHQFHLLRELNPLAVANPGATFLLNSSYEPAETWEKLPVELQEEILRKGIRVFVIDAVQIAKVAGLGAHVNTVLQTCFFALSGVLPREQAIEEVKAAVRKSYRRRGEVVIERNCAAIDQSLSGLHELDVPLHTAGDLHRRPAVPAVAPDFVQRVTAAVLRGEGDLLPVSALPVDGTFPTGTARWEKRGIAAEIPIWDPEVCIECAKCALVCPHAAIRMKVFDPAELAEAPFEFQSRNWLGRDFPGSAMTIQVAPDDCTGCGVCVDVCPAHRKDIVKHRAINMAPREEHADRERANFDFFLDLPEPDRSAVNAALIKGSQMLQPLFEFSGACAGCGETPYLKLITQLFGERMVVANATGCSSIYGGNLPTTPWSTTNEGRGPAWANSLFEDNAEFGLGIRIALDEQVSRARRLVEELAPAIGVDFAREILEADQSFAAGIEAQRERVERLDQVLAGLDAARFPAAAELRPAAQVLVDRSLWIVGGDGWAYDIGFGGLDHALASGRNINTLVLDTEVYSNTGGQASKSTPKAAVAKFAAQGKQLAKKDLGMLAMAYGNVYVAQVAIGADNQQTIRALIDAEAHPGPSLVIAYSQCIAHGIDMRTGMTHQREAVDSGYWPLYRYAPESEGPGGTPLHLDSRAPKIPFKEFAQKEARFAMLELTNPAEARRMHQGAQDDIDERWRFYQQAAGLERRAPELPSGHADSHASDDHGTPSTEGERDNG